MKAVNKLVRDNIPNIIIDNKEIPLYYKLEDDKVYYKELCKKLIEETKEFMDSDEVEELADICEVIIAILQFKNIDLAEFKKIMNKKTMNIGNFSGRTFLLGIK